MGATVFTISTVAPNVAPKIDWMSMDFKRRAKTAGGLFRLYSSVKLDAMRCSWKFCWWR